VPNINVILAASTLDWQNRVLRYAHDHGELTVRALVISSEQALRERCHVFVFDDRTSFVGRSLIRDLKTRGTLVLGVYDAREPAEAFLAERGVDDTIASDAEAGEFVARIQALASPALLDATFDDIAAHLDPELAEQLPTGTAPAAQAGPPPGRVLAVASPSGGCGATEVAVGLSLILHRRGSRVILVDADDVRPSVAQRLGLPLSPNLRLAAEMLDSQPERVGEAIVTVEREGLQVLCGLPSPRDWDDLRPGDVTELLGQLAGFYDPVVVNVGPHTEDLPTIRAGRFAITRGVLQTADELIVVAAATPRGVRWLLDWAAGVRDADVERPVHVVFNRGPRGGTAQAELERELTRTFRPTSLSFLPLDARVTDAEWTGTAVSGGPFTKALAALAATVVPAAPSGMRRRRGRARRREGARR
jgi:MinD-like ATPase involved in chromosome partitioning or flagellar assembly